MEKFKIFQTINGEPTLLVLCLYQMLPLNHKRTTSSLAPPIFYVAKNSAIKNRRLPIRRFPDCSKRYLQGSVRHETLLNIYFGIRWSNWYGSEFFYLLPFFLFIWKQKLLFFFIFELKWWTIEKHVKKYLNICTIYLFFGKKCGKH